ncbi:MAG: rhomboid family intramembrane serine protease [Elusimicrobiales bacterium]|nr:rhomboid family intramembrane serine protease [Elusimicrobiales bacterium]
MRNIAPMLFGSLPKATKALIYICAGVFVLELFLKNYLVYYFGLIPLRVIDSFWIWQTVTYLFLHGGFWHFFFNILMLWIFGRIIESALGTREFLFYFFVCGIGAGIISIVFSFGSPRPIIGASGAIYGLMVAFAILYPKQIVYLYFVLPVKAWQMAAILVVMELAMSFSTTNSNIANVAHLGGMFIGYLYFKLGRKNFQFNLSHFSLFNKDDKVDDSAEIDRILDKISKKGLESLSAKEKEILDKFSGHS